MRNIITTLFLVVLCQFTFAQTSLNINLVGQVTTPGDLNDVWAYVAGNGTEYGICGVQSGGEIIVSLANPSNPTVVQTLPGPATLWRDMKTHGDYAYITNEASGGIRIIDLRNLPNSAPYKDTIINGMNTAHNIYIDDGYAYVVGGDNGSGGMDILDLSDPWYPNLVGQYAANYVHDVYVRDDVAYAGELSDGLVIINVANKANPTIMAVRQYPGNFTHNTWLNDAGDVVFTTDEVSAGKITAFDISNLNNIEFLDEIQSSLSPAGDVIPHNAHVLNDYIVTSYYRDGLHITDAARPHNLIETGYYDTSPLVGDGFDGNWGATPFLPSGHILASDMQSGLFVLGPTYTRGCYLEGEVTDASNGNPINGANINIQTVNVLDMSDIAGDYATGTATPGTYNVVYSKFGYRDSTISTTLTNGQLVIQDVPLQPAASVNFTVNVVEQGTNNPIANAEVVFAEVTGAAELSYTANGSGIVNDPAMVEATYEVIAGKWGWRTKSVPVTVNQATTTITIELPVGYYDDYALDFSWITSSFASSGDWEREEPIGTSGGGGGGGGGATQYNPEFDITTDISDKCYVTGNDGGGIGNDDIDGGIVYLTSPNMDLRTYTEPVLKYYRWFANGGG
ncbi:MAG: choice-of-anchor B family protein, partial [Bacteroidota bacterium]